MDKKPWPFSAFHLASASTTGSFFSFNGWTLKAGKDAESWTSKQELSQ